MAMIEPALSLAQPRTPTEVGHLLARLVEQRRTERNRLQTISKWYDGAADGLYVPEKVTAEYRTIVDQSKFNVLPLIERTVRQALAVDGYRPTIAGGRVPAVANSPAWDIWQANRLDSRQSKLWGQAVRYGWSYAMVLPASPFPEITPFSPTDMTTVWRDCVNDEWPEAAMILRGGSLGDGAGDQPVSSTAPRHSDHGAAVTIIDEHYVYKLVNANGQWGMEMDAQRHGLGVCPIVRFPDEEPSYDRPEAVATGKIEPVLHAQRQLNQITYSLAMALQYGAHRQRYVSGMTIEVDPMGAPIEPFNPGVDRLFHATDPNVKWGEFGQTDVSGYLDARDKLLGYIGAVTQVPPHNLVAGGQVSNVNAEALASLQYGHRRDLAEHERLFGEGVEQMLRLAGLASGDRDLWEDLSARAHWADTTPRTLAEEADALGKMATMLGIPVRMLWRRLSGVTDQELKEWEAAAAEDERARVMELAAMADEAAADQADEDDGAPGPDRPAP